MTKKNPAVLPERLAAGPCVEIWGQPLDGREYSRARQAWRAEVRRWARRNGTSEPAAAALARTTQPWSRTFLLGRGETNTVDYYEGRAELLPSRIKAWRRY